MNNLKLFSSDILLIILVKNFPLPLKGKIPLFFKIRVEYINGRIEEAGHNQQDIKGFSKQETVDDTHVWTVQLK